MDSDGVCTTLPAETFKDNFTNGYLDQDAIFTNSLPLWNSENLHEDLLAGFLPQYYGVLDIQPGDE